MTIKNRLIKFAKLQEIPIARFERACGMSNGYMNSIRKSPGVEKLDNILRAYPYLNRDWLLTGDGEMIISNAKKKEEEETRLEKNKPADSEITMLKKKIVELKKEIEMLKEEKHTLIDTNSRLSMILQDVSMTTKMNT